MSASKPGAAGAPTLTREQIVERALARRRVSPETTEVVARALPAPLLTLEAIEPERPTIRINGADYRLSFQEDFTLAQERRFDRLQARANELGAIDDIDALTDEQFDAVSEAMDDAYRQMVRLVLPDCPTETVALLHYQQCAQIIQAFLVAVARQNAMRTAALAARPTGGSSSARSRRATAKGSGTGSRMSRSAT